MGKQNAEGNATSPAARTLDGIRTLAKAATHDCRMKILTRLVEDGPASPSAMSRSRTFAKYDIGIISAHCRRLEALGLISLDREIMRRGATEHVYKAVRRPFVTAEEWKELHPVLRPAFTGHTLECMWADVAGSYNAGLLDVREDRVVSRTPAVVDQQGWNELVEIQSRAVAETLGAVERAGERLAGDEDVPRFKVSVGQMCFEVPLEDA